jgi:hypothetical protein
MKSSSDLLGKNLHSLIFISAMVLLSACSGGIKQQTMVKPFLTGLETWPEVYRQNFQAMSDD